MEMTTMMLIVNHVDDRCDNEYNEYNDFSGLATSQGYCKFQMAVSQRSLAGNTYDKRIAKECEMTIL